MAQFLARRAASACAVLLSGSGLLVELQRVGSCVWDRLQAGRPACVHDPATEPDLSVQAGKAQPVLRPRLSGLRKGLAKPGKIASYRGILCQCPKERPRAESAELP